MLKLLDGSVAERKIYVLRAETRDPIFNDGLTIVFLGVLNLESRSACLFRATYVIVEQRTIPCKCLRPGHRPATSRKRKKRGEERQVSRMSPRMSLTWTRPSARRRRSAAEKRFSRSA